jgi:hypothetical protein
LGDVCEFFVEKPPGSGGRVRLRRLVLPFCGSLAPLALLLWFVIAIA